MAPGSRTLRDLALVACAVALCGSAVTGNREIGDVGQAGQGPDFHDSHFHLTNYIQEGTDVRRFLQIMGTRAGRSTLFGIPLQQTWSYANSGDFAPTYYLQTDAPLYYYSFTDAYIAMAYQVADASRAGALRPDDHRLQPGGHVRAPITSGACCATFPGVFTGIGEFTIHKEFVSSKVAGESASLTDPALDRILDFAAEAGLVVILHNDIDMPFAKTDAEPVYLAQMKALLRRHPKAHDHLGAHAAWAAWSIRSARRPTSGRPVAPTTSRSSKP